MEKEKRRGRKNKDQEEAKKGGRRQRGKAAEEAAEPKEGEEVEELEPVPESEFRETVMELVQEKVKMEEAKDGGPEQKIEDQPMAEADVKDALPKAL